MKNATGVDISKLAEKWDLASLKAEIEKLNVDKLKTIPIDLSKLSNVVSNEVVKKTASFKFFRKVNNVDTNAFVLKTKYTADKSDLPQQISEADKNFL